MLSSELACGGRPPSSPAAARTRGREPVPHAAARKGRKVSHQQTKSLFTERSWIVVRKAGQLFLTCRGRPNVAGNSHEVSPFGSARVRGPGHGPDGSGSTTRQAGREAGRAEDRQGGNAGE